MDMKERQKNIKIWLLQNDITMVRINREVGVSLQSVSHTVKGIRSCAGVLAWLREHGCPEKYVQHPNEKKAEEKKAA